MSADIEGMFFQIGVECRDQQSHQRTARDNIGQYPDATKDVLENFYMDDYLDLVESPERDLNRSKELVHLLRLGGFKHY